MKRVSPHCGTNYYRGRVLGVYHYLRPQCSETRFIALQIKFDLHTHDPNKAGFSLVRQIQTGVFYTSRKIARFLFRIFNIFVSVYSSGAAQKHALKNHGRYTGEIVRKHTLTHRKQARQNSTTDSISDDNACFIMTYYVLIKFYIELVRTVSV